MTDLTRRPKNSPHGWYVNFGYLTTQGLRKSMALEDDTLGYFKSKQEATEALRKFELKEYRRLKRKFEKK